MSRHKSHPKRTELCSFLALLALSFFFAPFPAAGENALLKELISVYNTKAYEQSIKDGSYRGEEGILRIGPEAAQSHGLKVYTDQAYKEAKELFLKAEKSLQSSRRALYAAQKETFPGEHAQRVADHFLLYKKAVDAGVEKITVYRARLNPRIDERLQRETAARLLDKLLTEGLQETRGRLRDALGRFYNLCKGLNHTTPYLTPVNISFVNEIFSQFSARADEDSKKKFDFDRSPKKVPGHVSAHWKKVVGKRCEPFIPLIEATFEKNRHNPYAVDPLLFAALMKRESNFDARALSPVGAAGLLQIMPSTAKELGMKNIYQPGYFDSAFELMTQERSTRHQAMEFLYGITEKNQLESAEKARGLIRKSLALERKKDGLLERYRKTLLKKGGDDRFTPAHAIAYGYKYLSNLLRDQRGDLSLALASYNAGPHRVEQYGGIPPYSETVHFRNMVLKYYREYLKKAEEAT